MTDDLRFRPGIQASAVIGSLEPLIVQGRNIAASGGGTDPMHLQNGYLQWVEAVERALQHLFVSSWVWEGLHSRRWTQIARLDENTARPFPLVTDEARTQSDRLEAIVEQLKRSAAQFELPAEAIAAVPDTNVFLHWQFFKEVDWPKLVGAKKARLVVPLLIVEQLDRRTYSRVESERRRAKRVLRALHEFQEGLATPEAPVDVGANVSLQMLGDPQHHVRSQNEDEELLDRTGYLSSLVGGRLVILTRDKAMEVRARLLGLTCRYLLDDEQTE